MFTCEVSHGFTSWTVNGKPTAELSPQLRSHVDTTFSNTEDGNHTNNKWKNHFYEMKGDVGMSLHEKERNKKMPTPTHKVTHNPIPTSLFCFNMLFVCLL